MIRRLKVADGTPHTDGSSRPRWRQQQLCHELENVVQSSGRKLNCIVLGWHGWPTAKVNSTTGIHMLNGHPV